MTIAVKHKFTSPKADGTDSSFVQPSEWNDSHSITLAAGKIFGRNDATPGDAEELPLSYNSGTGNFTFVGTGWTGLPVGNTAARGTGTAGAIRYNSQTGFFEGFGTGWNAFVQGAGANTVDVMTFGAVGDGVTDDTAAIDAAHASAEATGLVLTAPAKSFVYKGPMTLTNLIGGIFMPGAVFVGTGAAGSCFIFSAGNYDRSYFVLPQIQGYPGAGIHDIGGCDIKAFCPLIISCTDGLLLETFSTILTTINNTWTIGKMQSMTQSGIHFKMNVDATPNHQSLQGNTVFSNFINGCNFGVWIDCASNQITGCNDCELRLGSIDGDSLGGAIGFACTTGIMNGPFLLECQSFMGNNPAGDIILANGGNGLTFICGWPAVLPYGNFQANGEGNRVTVTFPQGGAFNTPIACSTTSNNRAGYNGGAPIVSNYIYGSVHVPGGTGPGGIIDAYLYSPLTTGDSAMLDLTPRIFGWGTFVTIEDISTVVGNFGVGPHANEIHLRFISSSTYIADTEERFMLQIGR